MTTKHFRFLQPHIHLGAPFGTDTFGKKAEAFARFFGTPTFLASQTVVVIVWIVFNMIGVGDTGAPTPPYF